MNLKKLRMKNFRVYDDVEMSFNDKVNLVFGKNGSGKSSIVLALYAAIKQGVQPWNIKRRDPEFSVIMTTEKGEIYYSQSHKNSGRVLYNGVQLGKKDVRNIFEKDYGVNVKYIDYIFGEKSFFDKNNIQDVQEFVNTDKITIEDVQRAYDSYCDSRDYPRTNIKREFPINKNGIELLDELVAECKRRLDNMVSQPTMPIKPESTVSPSDLERESSELKDLEAKRDALNSELGAIVFHREPKEVFVKEEDLLDDETMERNLSSLDSTVQWIKAAESEVSALRDSVLLIENKISKMGPIPTLEDLKKRRDEINIEEMEKKLETLKKRGESLAKVRDDLAKYKAEESIAKEFLDSETEGVLKCSILPEGPICPLANAKYIDEARRRLASTRRVIEDLLEEESKLNNQGGNPPYLMLKIKEAKDLDEQIANYDSTPSLKERNELQKRKEQHESKIKEREVDLKSMRETYIKIVKYKEGKERKQSYEELKNAKAHNSDMENKRVEIVREIRSFDDKISEKYKLIGSLTADLKSAERFDKEMEGYKDALEAFNNSKIEREVYLRIRSSINSYIKTVLVSEVVSNFITPLNKMVDFLKLPYRFDHRPSSGIVLSYMDEIVPFIALSESERVIYDLIMRVQVCISTGFRLLIMDRIDMFDGRRRAQLLALTDMIKHKFDTVIYLCTLNSGVPVEDMKIFLDDRIKDLSIFEIVEDGRIVHKKGTGIGTF